MTDKQLRKLSRMELLEILLDQRKKIDELEKELEEKNELLESRRIKIKESGSIAEASLALTKVFEEAQKAADLYLENIKRRASGEPVEELFEEFEEETAEEETDGGEQFDETELG